MAHSKMIAYCTNCRHFQPPAKPHGAGQCLAVSMPAITARAQACGTFGHLFEAAPLPAAHPRMAKDPTKKRKPS